MPSERDALAEFKAAAEKYIALIETAVKPAQKKTRPKARRDDVLADFADALSTLYGRALHLPEIWDGAWTFDGEREFTDEESERRAPIYRELSQKFGGIDFYRTVVAFGRDALDEHGQPLSDHLAGHLLSDDLGDIYWGLQEGFDLLRAGGPEGEAVYTWHWGFWNHWAEHAVNALRIIHARLPRANTLIGSEE
ncbi:MAG: DUF5063 domain-containing protein [Gaiellaceae bacterium]